MIYYSRIGIIEGIDLSDSKNSKKCLIVTISILIMGLAFKNKFVVAVMIC